MLQILGAVAVGFVLGNRKAQETINSSMEKLGASAVDFLNKTTDSGDNNAQQTDTDTEM